MRSDDPRLAIKISHVLLIPDGAGELVSALRQRCECKIPPDVCMVTNDTPDVSVKMAYYLGFVKVPKQEGLDVVEHAVKANSEKRALNEKKRVDRNKPKSSLLMGVSKTDDIGTHVSEYPVAIIMSGRSTRFVDVLNGGTISKFMLKQVHFRPGTPLHEVMPILPPKTTIVARKPRSRYGAVRSSTDSCTAHAAYIGIDQD